MRVLAAQGCTYLQLDDTSPACLNDPRQRELVRSKGDDGHRQHLRNTAEINAALEDRPEGLTVTTHLCRGDFRSSWAVPLEQLALSPQCGFSSTVEGNALTLDDQRAELQLVVETASEVWG